MSRWVFALLLAGCIDEPLCPEGEVDCDGVCISPPEPSWTTLTERVLPGCTVCHRGSGAPEGLDLSDPERAYDALVFAPSRQSPELDLVEPGNGADSYLVRKLRGEGMAAASSTGESSVRMPAGGPYLCDPTLDAIEQWIDEGALPDER